MNPRNENQGRGPTPKHVDGTGIVIAVLGGVGAWIGIAALAHMVARWVA